MRKLRGKIDQTPGRAFDCVLGFYIRQTHRPCKSPDTPHTISVIVAVPVLQASLVEFAVAYTIFWQRLIPHIPRASGINLTNITNM